MARFEDLSDDVLYLVIQYWHPDRFSGSYCLRLVSARLKVFAESVLFRNIILEDDDQHELSSYRFIERLSSPEDTLSQHVRCLQITSFKGDHGSFCMDTKLIKACLKGLERLNAFSWDCDVPLPYELLSILHQRFPKARLCAASKTLDHALLYSPQLYSLAISLPDLELTDHKSSSQWEQLKQILSQCRNLRALTLDVHPNRTFRVEALLCFFGNAMQIPLEPSDTLPALEDLEIRAKIYNLDAKHCAQLLHCMDWRKLKRLRLGPSNPEAFFRVFRDQLAQLEILELTYIYEDQYWVPYYSYQPKLSACADFVASIAVLKKLVVRCDTINLRDRLWTSLVEVHGAHLQRLSIQARYEELEAPDCKGDLWDLLASLSKLAVLDLALRTRLSMTYGCSFCPREKHALSTTYIGSIPVVKSLRSLQISVRVNLCDHSLYSYIADHAHCAIRKIWTAYTNDPRDCELESFTMVFWRWEPTSPHPDENGFPRNVHINKVVFESKMIGGRLLIRPRNNRKVHPIYYTEVWHETDGEGPRATYVAEQQKVSEPSFIFSGRFHQALGSLFQQPADGTRLMRYR